MFRITAKFYSLTLEELKRLSRMTSDMLFLARSEHGLLRLDKHDVDLAAELNELRELFEPPADETGKTITVEGEGVVAGDSDMLRRAFSNLLSNAIKYSPDNTCTAIHIERDSDCVNVMITNTMSGRFPLIWNVCLTGSIAQTHQGSTTRKARGWDYQLQGRSFMLTAASCQQNSRGGKLCSVCVC